MVEAFHSNYVTVVSLLFFVILVVVCDGQVSTSFVNFFRNFFIQIQMFLWLECRSIQSTLW